MIRQDDKRLAPAINNWGCYFMAILYHASVKLNKEFSPEEIEAIYKAAMFTGIIDKEKYDENGVLIDGCFIRDPMALFKLCGVGFSGFEKTGADYVCKTDETEIQLWHRDKDTPKGMGNGAHDHFVAAVGGNVVYDGLGKSNTVKYGYLKSKRVFR